MPNKAPCPVCGLHYHRRFFQAVCNPSWIYIHRGRSGKSRTQSRCTEIANYTAAQMESYRYLNRRQGRWVPGDEIPGFDYIDIWIEHGFITERDGLYRIADPNRC